MVNAGQLTQPLDRPQGLSSVTNPSAASGAADPASADEARASAPLPTLTIGRVVSLEDYQNFALGFAGIAKALATWTWFGNVRGVFLTVAGANGAILSGDDPVVTAADRGDPAERQSECPAAGRVLRARPLHVRRRVSRSTRRTTTRTRCSRRSGRTLSAAFAFGQRQLGQSVAASEIIEIIQQTARGHRGPARGAGAERRAALPGAVPAMLCASGPRPAAGRADAAARSRDPGQHRSLVMSLDADQLFALLPAVYRTRDAANGGPLQALFAVIAAQSGIVEDNIEQLYDDQFIETCAPWVIPYHRRPDRLQLDLRGRLGQLRQPRRGRQHDRLPPPQGHAARARAAGDAMSPAAPPSRSRSSSRLITTESMRHVRPRHDATVNLRRGRRPRTVSGTAFDTPNRTIDVRRIAPRVAHAADPDPAPLDIALHGPGRFNIPDIAIHLWRWQSWPVTDAPAFPLGGGRYMFSPLGHDMPLFSQPRGRARLQQPDHAPGRAAADRPGTNLPGFYGPAGSVLLIADGDPVDATQVYGANLSDRPGGAWCTVASGRSPSIPNSAASSSPPTFRCRSLSAQLLVRLPRRDRRRSLRPLRLAVAARPGKARTSSRSSARAASPPSKRGRRLEPARRPDHRASSCCPISRR